jgi:hypothetical protein
MHQCRINATELNDESLNGNGREYCLFGNHYNGLRPPWNTKKTEVGRRTRRNISLNWHGGRQVLNFTREIKEAIKLRTSTAQ